MRQGGVSKGVDAGLTVPECRGGSGRAREEIEAVYELVFDEPN